jgi:hypothetical protein
MHMSLYFASSLSLTKKKEMAIEKVEGVIFLSPLYLSYNMLF